MLTKIISDTVASTSTVNKIVPSELLQTEIDQASEVYQLIVTFFTNYSFQLIGALIIFLLGYYVAGKISQAVLRLCERQNLDVTLSRFLASTTKMMVIIMVTIVSLNKLGISVT